MAKCIGSKSSWTTNIIELDDTSFIVDCAKVGENVLNLKLEEISVLVQDIANDFSKLKQSAQHDDNRWDCYQVQEALMTKLDRLLTETPSVIQHICKSDLINATKHRYFFHFSCGAIDRLKQLLLTVGRLSDLEESIYIEEQRKPLVSEESITIHALTAIWLATIETMNCFQDPARELFKEQLGSEEYTFIKQLDFWVAGVNYSKILIMDLIITSWIQFNRLVKYEDLEQALPFLCSCHTRIYFKVLLVATNGGKDIDFLNDLLPAIIDYECKPSMRTPSVREYGIIPIEPCYSKTDQTVLAYFLIWHLCSLARIVNESDRYLISQGGAKILQQYFDTAMRQFLPSPTSSNEFRLSPNQEERFKLVFSLLDSWCEKNPDNTSLIILMLSFFEDYWNIFGEKYFDVKNFRVGGLTIFQLFTKLVYTVIPINTVNRQASYDATSDKETDKSDEEKNLVIVWDKLLDRCQPKPQAKSVTTSTTTDQLNEK